MDGRLDIPSTLRNIVSMLQVDPRKYRCFGVYWWPVKALLKAGGYGPEQLALLGDYADTSPIAQLPAMPPDSMLRAALEEFALNVRYNLGRADVVTPDGEPYQVVDEDAGL